MSESYETMHVDSGSPVKMWTRGVPVEAEAREQLAKAARLPFIFRHVAAMPDVHVGKGSTVGSVIPTRKAVIPAAVGVDIGCGMIAVKTSLTARDLPDNLSAVRTAIERELDLDLRALIEAAFALQPVEKPASTADEIWAYMMERLRSSYIEGENGRAVTTEMFDSVLAGRSYSPKDIDLRLQALETFLALPEAESLAAANKRIANILRKAPDDLTGAVDTSRLQDTAERQLFEHVVSMERAVNPLFSRREYTRALTQLATLREDVDRFFDSVMVMAEDPEIRANRLALLMRLRGLFLQFADLSRLPG